MSEPPRPDDEFERALRARRRLLPTLDEDQSDAPSAELDRLVIERARRALRDPQPQAVPKVFPLLNWGVPLALAATLVLSFTLVMQMDSQDPVARAAGPAKATATAPVPQEAPATLTDDSGPATAAAQARAVPSRERMESNPAPAADSMGLAKSAAGASQSAAQNAAPARADVAVEYAAQAAAPLALPSSAASMARPLRSTDDPRRWLVAIEALRTAGEAAEADRQLSALRARYPDFVVETELERLRKAGR